MTAPRWGHLLTADEVAGYLKCHVSTVYDMVSKGRLQGFSLTGNTDKHKRGRKGLRILASSVDDLVTRGLHEQTPPVEATTSPAAVQMALARPAPTPRPTTPARAQGSRVVLPFPGGTS